MVIERVRKVFRGFYKRTRNKGEHSIPGGGGGLKSTKFCPTLSMNEEGEYTIAALC